MRKFLSDIDHLLRGAYTQPEDLRDGSISMPARALVIGGLLLGAIYGLFMGMYGATRPDSPTAMQLLATTLKVPLLFLLTLVVTFPSLYVLSALAGSRLRFLQTLRLLLAAIAVNLALLASLGPVVGFFTLSTQSYPFMIVLNVVIFAASGLAGLVFLRHALVHVFTPLWHGEPAAPVEAVQQPESGGPEPAPAGAALRAAQTVVASAAPSTSGDHAQTVFRGWLFVYGIVGAQMGWVLRPFIGSPELPFTWFREREGNFLLGLFRALASLFS